MQIPVCRKKNGLCGGGYERRMFAPQSAAYRSQSRYADGMRDMPQERKQQDAAWSILWSERQLCSDYTTWRIAHTGCPRHQIYILTSIQSSFLSKFFAFQNKEKRQCTFTCPLQNPAKYSTSTLCPILVLRSLTNLARRTGHIFFTI